MALKINLDNVTPRTLSTVPLKEILEMDEDIEISENLEEEVGEEKPNQDENIEKISEDTVSADPECFMESDDDDFDFFGIKAGRKDKLKVPMTFECNHFYRELYLLPDG